MPKKKNTHWRRSITTEERLALTLRLVHITCNCCLHRHQNKHIAKGISFLVNNLREFLAAGRSRTSLDGPRWHMPCPCRALAVQCRGLEKSLSERHGRSTANRGTVWWVWISFYLALQWVTAPDLSVDSLNLLHIGFTRKTKYQYWYLLMWELRIKGWVCFHYVSELCRRR